MSVKKIEDMKITELKDYAKTLGMKGVYKLKKKELLETISEFLKKMKI